MSGAPYHSPSHNPNFPSQPPATTNPVLGIISLVAGILSFVPGCCCGLIGIPMALAAIGTGIAAMVMPNQGAGKGMGIAGIACGAVYLLLTILAFILQVTGAIGPEVFNQFQQMQNP